MTDKYVEDYNSEFISNLMMRSFYAESAFNCFLLLVSFVPQNDAGHTDE